MSGLEPLAALGLVCNVLQLAAYACNAIHLLRQIKAEHSPDASLQRHAQALRALSAKVVRGLKRNDDGSRALADDDENVLDAASECQLAARELGELLQAAPTAARGGLRAWRVVAWVLTKRQRLEQLEARLERTQGLLHMAVILHAIHDTALDHSKLSPAHRAMVQRIQGGQTDLMEVVFQDGVRTRQHVTFESDLTRSQVTDATARSQRSAVGKTESGQKLTSILVTREPQRTWDVTIRQPEHKTVGPVDDGLAAHQVRHDAVALAHGQEREMLLGSLAFPEQNARRNQVGRHAVGTFEWLWEEHHDRAAADPERARWNGFTKWLESGSASSPIFWITGKPGSGKSTLVQSILAHANTLHTVRRWSQDDEAVIVSHFFWGPGAPLQRSYRGFLCSVLLQLLRNNSLVLMAVLGLLLDMDPAVLKTRKSPLDWPIQDLERCCREALQCRGSRAACLLIDAVDEIDQDGDDLADLVDFVDDLGRIPTVKICIASRPEPMLRAWLGARPRLRVQDLTSQDMETFARAHLNIPSSAHQRDDSGPYKGRWQQQRELDRLCRQLCEKAEGVFLWIRLAIVSVNRGLKPGDSMADIEARIRRLPAGLCELFKEMWERINKGDRELHQQKAALYFHAVVRAREPIMCRLFVHPRHTEVDMLDVVLTACPDLADRILAAAGPSGDLVADIEDECRGLVSEIGQRCAGLLEYQEFESDLWEWEQSTRASKYYGVANAKVVLIHQSAYEFFVEMAEGAEILSKAAMTDFQARIRLATAYLAACRVAFWITRMPFNIFPFFEWLRGLTPDLDPVLLAESERLFRLGEALYGEGVFETRPWIKPSRMLSTETRPHYLSLAFRRGLEHLIGATLAARPVPSDTKTALFITACGWGGVGRTAFGPSGFPGWMLRGDGGVDPNAVEEVGDGIYPDWPHNPFTPRSLFVAFLQYATRASHQGRGRVEEPETWLRRFLYGVVAFLRRGADLSVRVPFAFLFDPSKRALSWLDVSTDREKGPLHRGHYLMLSYAVEACVLVRELMVPAIDLLLLARQGREMDGDQTSLPALVEQIKDALIPYADRRGCGHVERFLDADPSLMASFGRWSSRLVSESDAVALSGRILAILRDGAGAMTPDLTEKCWDAYLRQDAPQRLVRCVSAASAVWEEIGPNAEGGEGHRGGLVEAWRWIVGEHVEQDAVTAARVEERLERAMVVIRAAKEGAERRTGECKRVSFEPVVLPGTGVGTGTRMGGGVGEDNGSSGGEEESSDDDDGDKDDDDDDEHVHDIDDSDDDDDDNDDDDDDDDNDDDDDSDTNHTHAAGAALSNGTSHAPRRAQESEADGTSETVVQSDDGEEEQGGGINNEASKDKDKNKVVDPEEDLIDLLIDI